MSELINPSGQIVRRKALYTEVAKGGGDRGAIRQPIDNIPPAPTSPDEESESDEGMFIPTIHNQSFVAHRLKRNFVSTPSQHENQS